MLSSTRPSQAKLIQVCFSKRFTSTLDSATWHIAPLKEGRIIAAWHPEKTVSYQNTRPVNIEDIEKQRKEAELARQINQRKQRKGYNSPDNLTLQQIFNAGKTEFYSRTREDRLYDTAAPIAKRK